MNTGILKSIFDKAKKESIKLFGKNRNKLQSTLFVENVCNSLLEFCPTNKNFQVFCQRINEDWCGKKSGEWLLDGVISEVCEIGERGWSKPFRTNIEWAIESEASTKLEDFLEDFTKLLHINSRNKLYLNGYKSNNFGKHKEYRDKRLKTATELLKKYQVNGNIYFGFWPSPADDFWEKVTIEKEIIQVYKWHEDNKYFRLI